MDISKTGTLGLLVLVLIEISLACQCDRPDTSLAGAYCHRLTDQTERIAIIKGEICHKEFDDGWVEHFMVIKDVYLEPIFFEKIPGPPQTIMPDYFSPNPSCITVRRAASYTQGPGQTMLLTSSENRGGFCGIPNELVVGNTYVMEILYYGGVWDITSCAFRKEERLLTPAETASLQTFKLLRNPPPGANPIPPSCPSDPLPTLTPGGNPANPARRRWK